MKLALFDFDGTISRKDSLLDFLEYSFGKTKSYLGLLWLSPVVIKYKTGLISNQTAKEKLIKYFYGGWSSKEFSNLAEEYSIYQLEKIIRPDALNKILWHKEKGHDVVVVSASIECWLKGWCAKYDIDLIATLLEEQDNCITGEFLTKNCHGIEKVSRIKNKYKLSLYDHIYAYGDSKGDREMLNSADEVYYRFFNE